jgi:NAD(P)-dependent dehydrogenase (short-subunit alcohol dehydrogenase family)
MALVTGASRGIGEACARALARAGARLALAARSADDLARVAASIPGDPLVFTADLAASGAAKDLAARATAALGGLDILVNCAGATYNRRSHKLDEAQFDQVMWLNCRGPLLLCTALAQGMVRRGGGSIINISSTAGLRGSPFQAAYAASKGAMDAFTRALACEWGPAGIRVNSIAPGLVVTSMWEKGRTIEGMIETMQNQVPLRRWGEPDDIADVVVFLASDGSRYINGQTITVDGGMMSAFDPTFSAAITFGSLPQRAREAKTQSEHAHTATAERE